MAEPIFMRVRRVISANIEDTVDQMERAGGAKVMAEAIREVDRVVDEVRAEHEAATSRRLQAVRQQRMIAEKLSALESKARFALGQSREDLAEAAIARQIELEEQTTKLDTCKRRRARRKRGWRSA
jgi:phage shock protein A